MPKGAKGVNNSLLFQKYQVRQVNLSKLKGKQPKVAKINRVLGCNKHCRPKSKLGCTMHAWTQCFIPEFT